MTDIDLNVRPYLESDEDRVVALWTAVFPTNAPRNEPRAYIRRKLEIQRDLFLVGEWGDRIVATVVGGYDGVRGWIYHLAVAEDLRRKGIGRRMTEAAEKELAKMGCPKVNLQIYSTNDGVVAFYEALGYRVEERISMGKVLDR